MLNAMHRNSEVELEIGSVEMAPAPYAHTRFTFGRACYQYMTLLRLLLTDYREDWQFQLYASVLTPLALAFFSHSANGQSDLQNNIFILGGSLAMSVVMGPAMTLLFKLGGVRQSHSLDFWIALPVRKHLLILAFTSVALLFALPGFLATYVLNSLLLGVPFSLSNSALLLLIPLAVFPLAGFYAVIAVYLPTANVVSIVSNVLTIFLGLFTPLMVKNLPGFLRLVSMVLPTTYAADAFRAVLGGGNTNLMLDIIVLIVAMFISSSLSSWKLDWRSV